MDADADHQSGRTAHAVKRQSFQKVIVDSTVQEKTIAHPTDSKLLERARQHFVNLAAEAGLTPRQNYNREAPKLAVQVGCYHHKPKRDITKQQRHDIRHRSAIEPAIGHMKSHGRLWRHWLKGVEGDAFHALLCGCGHNLCMILRNCGFFLP